MLNDKKINDKIERPVYNLTKKNYEVKQYNIKW